MKITSRQLRQIIQEELRRVIPESNQHHVSTKFELDNNGNSALASDFVEAIKNVKSDLDLAELMRNSIDTEALDKYEEKSYLTDWMDKITNDMKKKTGVSWEIGRSPEFLSDSVVSFSIAPADPYDGNVNPPVESVQVSYNSQKMILKVRVAEMF